MIAITRISDQPTSSMATSLYVSCAGAQLRWFFLIGIMVDSFGRIIRNCFICDTLFEILYAFGNIAHQFRNFTAAEKQQHDCQNDQPMPDRETTHG
jgi:hypothetical protein